MDMKDQKGVAQLGLIMVMIVALGFGFAVFNRVRQANDSRAERGSNNTESSRDEDGVRAQSEDELNDAGEVDEPDDSIDETDELDDDEVEAEEEDENETEAESEFEQVVYQDGLKKTVKIEYENGKLVLKIKYEGNGTERTEKLVLKPGENLAILKQEQNGVDRSVKLSIEDGKMMISRAGFAATSDFPIELDTANNALYVNTPIGRIRLNQLPDTVVRKALDSQVVDSVSEAKLSTNDKDKELVYVLHGIKQVKLLGLISIDAPVTAELKTLSDEPRLAQKPWYLDVLGFLFTS